MKKFLSMVVLTVLIIVITGVYVLFTRTGDREALTYLPNPDWSLSQNIAKASTEMYDCTVDEKGVYHAVWVDEDGEQQEYNIQYAHVEPTGIKTQPLRILTHEYIQDIQLDLEGDHLRVFWIGRGSGDLLDLFLSEFDRKGVLVDQRVIITNEFFKTRDLDIAQLSNGNYLAVWTDRVNSTLQVKSLAIDLKASERKAVQLTDQTGHSQSPRLLADGNDCHLVWSTLITETNAELFYSKLSTDAHLNQRPLRIDQGIINAPTLILQDQKLYLVWEKLLSEETGQCIHIVGTVLDLESSNPTITVTQLSEPNTLNFAPSLILDTSNQLHLVYGKSKDGHNSLVHKVYSADLSQVIKKANWIISQPQAVIGTYLMKDAKQNLYLSWVEAFSQQEKYIHYANSIQKYKNSPLQVIGITARHPLVNVFASIGYITALVFIDIRVLIVIFITYEVLVVILLLYYAIHRLLLFTKWNRFTEKLYVPTIIIMVVALLFLLLCLHAVKNDFFKWPLEMIKEHGTFVIGLSTLFLLIYSEFNRFRQKEIMYSLFLVYLWVFWVWVILITMLLPHLNYVIPPAI